MAGSPRFDLTHASSTKTALPFQRQRRLSESSDLFRACLRKSKSIRAKSLKNMAKVANKAYARTYACEYRFVADENSPHVKIVKCVGKGKRF